MERKFPKLSRPPRKLNFLPDKEGSPKQWGKKVTLEEVDRLFDNLDSSSDSFDSLTPLSPMPKTTLCSKEKEEVENKKASSGQQTGNNERSPLGPKGEVQPTAKPVEKGNHNKTFVCLKEASSPFVEHNPIKTSSPLEGEHIDEGAKAVSPIVFLFDEDDVPEEPKTASPSIARTQSQVQPLPDGSEQPLSTLPPEPPPPSTAGPQEPAAALPPRARKDHSFLQKLRATGQSKATWRSLFPLKEPSLPEEPAQETEEDFMILEDADAPPSWFSIPRKKDPSTFKHKGPNTHAQPVRNDAHGQPSSPDRGRKTNRSEKAETRDPPYGGESPSLEEGGTMNTKKVKATIPSPKKSATKRKAKTKGREVATEMAELEPFPSSGPVDRGKAHKTTKKKQDRKPASSVPWTSPGRRTSNNQAIRLKGIEVASEEPSSASVPKRSKPTGVPRDEGEETTRHKKARKPMKRRQREELLSSGPEEEPPPGDTWEELSPQQSLNNQAQHTGPAVTKARPLLTSSSGGAGPGRRSRKRPGERRPSAPRSAEEPALKAPKQAPRRPRARAAEPPPARTTQDEGSRETDMGTVTSPGLTAGRPDKRKARKTTNRRGATGKMVKRGGAPGVMEEEAHFLEQEVSPAKRWFDGTDQHSSPRRTMTNRTTGADPSQGSPEPAPEGSRRKTGRMRKAPVEWWMLSNAHADTDTQAPSSPPPSSPPPSSPPPSSPPPSPPPPSPPPPSSPPPQPRRQKTHKGGKRQSKQGATLTSAAPRDTLPVRPPPTPPRAAAATTNNAGSTPLQRRRMFSVPKTIRHSLATFQDIFTRTAEASPPNAARNAGQPEPWELTPGDPSVCHASSDVLPSAEAPAGSCSRRPRWPSSTAHTQPNSRRSGSMLTGFQSGPSSHVDLDPNEENEVFPLTTAHCTYWMSLGLHSPPLVPLVLQDEDEANLKEWLSVLWPTPVQEEARQTGPGDFEWFSHRDRAIGLQLDMCSASLCNGKLILGSYMKKPLWVDHCAITVFYMSTSCVVVTLDTKVSQYSSGQSFVVPCGQAYSIRNLEDQPAVMFFSWVQAESPE